MLVGRYARLALAKREYFHSGQSKSEPGESQWESIVIYSQSDVNTQPFTVQKQL